MSRILIIEDDQSLGYILKEYLQIREFDVAWAKDGEEGLDVFKQESFDICILDVMMPKKDGFTLAEEIKSLQPEMPLIFLTARSMKVDKLKGFKSGADDYIVKPVDEEELIARIKAVLRRSGHLQSTPDTCKIGAFTFNKRNQQLQHPNADIHLTQKESKVLEMLCSDVGKLVESDQVLKVLWGENNYFNRRSMDVYISKLRQYLKADPSIQITNVHGKGYILELSGNGE